MGNVDVKRRSIPKAIRREVHRKYNGHCAYCGCELEYKDMQVDHVESLYWHDGKDSIENYMPACRSCNFYKSTMTIEKFMEQLQSMPERLEKEFIYRLSMQYGLITEQNKPVKFYYETVGD
jgi:hypothetical protein